jgi:hypothetical protein
MGRKKSTKMNRYDRTDMEFFKEHKKDKGGRKRRSERRNMKNMFLDG